MTAPAGIRPDELAAHVGQEVALSDWITVDQARIDAFAHATGDHQFIHVDQEKAAQGPFGGTIAHGFLTLSLLPMLNAQMKTDFVITGHGNAVNYGSDKLRFLSPVPSGARIHAKSRLVSVDAGPKGTRVETEVAVHVVGNDRPALLYSMIVLYQGKVG